MAVAGSEFQMWLCSYLKSLNLDEEVIGEYIVGILDGDDSTLEEKQTALTETLQGMMETVDDTVSSAIFSKWNEFEEHKDKLRQEKESKTKDILAAVVEKHTKASSHVDKKSSMKIDENVKKNLIMQYGQEACDDVCSSSDDETQTNRLQCPSDKGLFENTNAKSVLDKQKEQREKQRQENANQKIKNKEDQEKQKAKAELRKEKERKRCQKGERRAR